MIKKIYGILMLGAFLFGATAQAYEMPIGIPTPSFGSVLGNPVEVAIPNNPSSWPSQEAPGFYYIDNTHGLSTDSGNTYGYPDKPRRSIPSTISAGSVVKINGGPYTYNNDFVITMNGTASSPVFVYGENKPVITGSRSQFYGSYFIFDNFDLEATRVVTNSISYATIRNTEVAGPSLQNGAYIKGDHIVFYNNNVHHHQGDDKHGATIGSGSSYVWVLGNELHHNGGDGIQFCHGCSTSPPEYIYVGGNRAYSNRENGIDLKYSRNVIVSQNETFNHHAISAGVEFCYDDGSGCTTGSSGSDGASIIVGSDGAPRNVWVLFNNVHDSGKGIRIEEGYDAVILGNVVHDVDNIGIEFEKTGEGPNTVAFNTIHNTTTGIKGPWQGGSLTITVDNNILSNISGRSINIDENAADCSASNNLFYNNGGSVSVQWGNTVNSVASGSAIDNMLTGSGNIVGDPQFRNPSQGEFSVLSSGAGVNKANSILATLDNSYKTIFGSNLTVLRDYAGNARSYTANDHDIGAFESDGTAGTAPPSPPVLY